MQWVRPLLVVLCFTLLAPIEVSAAEGRVALVIGNASYEEAPLRNPVNDSRAIAVSLRQLGFEVIEVEEADRGQMTAAILRFAQQLGPEDTGLFYYAGHGVQVDGSNYLIPLEAEIEGKLSVQLQALNVAVVLDAMEGAGSRPNIVILDACRNNPYERSLRGQSRGLAAIDAAKGTLIAYATAPGEVAADGKGKHGVYTEALLNALVIPGLQVEEVFKKVRVEVERRTKGKQIPWESSSLTGDFVFKPGNSISTQPLAESSTDELYWRSIENSGNAVLYKAYLEHFPDGIFVAIARYRLKLLEEAATTAPDLLITELDVEDPVPLLLASAQESLSALRLTTPEENNAFEQFSEVLGLEPDNVEAKSGLAQIADKYIGLARRAAKRGEHDKAKVYLDRAETVTPGNEAIAHARDEIEALAEEEQSTSSSSSLPKCPGSYNKQTWTKCFGTRTYTGGSKYVGEWRDGKQHGQGVFTDADGRKFVGEYQNARRWNGALYDRLGAQKGTYSNGHYTDDTSASQTTTSTSTQSTSSSSSLPKCSGSNTDYWNNCHGTRSIYGVGKYIGEWRLGRKHGHGTFYFGNGEKFVGVYKNNFRWSGVRYSQDGAVAGRYSNGSFRRVSSSSQTTTSTSTQSTSSSSSLPKCPGSYNKQTWTKCIGTRTYTSGSKYAGEWRDGNTHGQGTFTYGDGSKFVGEYRNGYRWNGASYGKDGNPILTYSGGRYTDDTSASKTTTSTSTQSTSSSSSLPKCPGSYNKQTWSKCIGTRTYTTGEKYAGAWWLGKRHGQGTHTFASGNKYVGEYRLDIRWRGALYDRLGAQKGTYSNGRYTSGTSASQTTTSTSTQSASSSSSLPKCPGSYHKHTWSKCFGTRTYNTGLKYAGAWWRGKRHGQGTYTWANGAKAYVGEYRNDEPWNGASYNRAGAQRGTYSNGRYTGGTSASQTTTPTATQSTSSSSSLPKCPGSYNKQTWSKCIGTRTYTSGSKSAGEWRDGKMHGQGTYTNKDTDPLWGFRLPGYGDKYVGEFRDGNYHGQGAFTFADGRKFVGELQNSFRWSGAFYGKDGNPIGSYSGGRYTDNTSASQTTTSTSTQSTSSSSSLPRCDFEHELVLRGRWTFPLVYWHKCHGTRVYYGSAPRGKFVGEFRKAERWNGKVHCMHDDHACELGREKGVYTNGVYKSL